MVGVTINAQGPPAPSPDKDQLEFKPMSAKIFLSKWFKIFWRVYDLRCDSLEIAYKTGQLVAYKATHPEILSSKSVQKFRKFI